MTGLKDKEIEMHDKFKAYIDAFPQLLEKLLNMTPASPSKIEKYIPAKGIYLLSENGNHLYVGRSNNIRSRISNHCRSGANHNQATFAFRIARQETEFKKATYQTKGSRKQIEIDPIFKSAFDIAKERVRCMELRYIEINEPVVQALFEIYASVVLKTPYNDFDNH